MAAEEASVAARAPSMRLAVRSSGLTAPSLRASLLVRQVLGTQAARTSAAGPQLSKASRPGHPAGPGSPASAASALPHERSSSLRFSGGARGLSIAAASVSAVKVAADGDTVRVKYTGRFEDGTVFDSSDGRAPLSFTLGEGQVVPGFETAVRGLRPGDKVSVRLPPEQAYGEKSDARIVTFPAAQTPKGLLVGQKIQLRSEGNGSEIEAVVVRIADDGAMTVDANAPLAGKTLLFDIELAGFHEPLAPAEAPAGLELATLAAGCFWGVELAFQRVPGVISTSVGYAQGHLERPTYENVCSATSGHTEAVRVVYDPKQVSFTDLLKAFWERVGRNATTLNVAGADRGPQYRSGIYFHTQEQERAARASVKALQDELGQIVVTEVEAAKPFWLAEDNHQQYLEMGGRMGNPQSAAKGCTETIRCYG